MIYFWYINDYVISQLIFHCARVNFKQVYQGSPNVITRQRSIMLCSLMCETETNTQNARRQRRECEKD